MRRLPAEGLADSRERIQAPVLVGRMGVGRKRVDTAAAHLVRTAPYAQQAPIPPALLAAGLLSAQREPEAGQLVGRDPSIGAAGHEA